jgi:hypothetical protein
MCHSSFTDAPRHADYACTTQSATLERADSADAHSAADARLESQLRKERADHNLTRWAASGALPHEHATPALVVKLYTTLYLTRRCSASADSG